MPSLAMHNIAWEVGGCPWRLQIIIIVYCHITLSNLVEDGEPLTICSRAKNLLPLLYAICGRILIASPKLYGCHILVEAWAI